MKAARRVPLSLRDAVRRRARRLVGTWRGEDLLRRQLADVAYLLSGNLAGSVIGLAAFALTARALGPADYGVLALLHSYARAVERLFSFQSWQPLIKFGAEARSQGRDLDFKALLKFGLLLDLAGAAAAWTVAVAAAVAAAPWLDWSDQRLTLVVLYCSTLLFSLTGMPTAVLRLSGRFPVIAVGQVANAMFRLLLCGVGLALGSGLLFFALVWAGLHALSAFTTMGFALAELRRLGVRGILRAPLARISNRFPSLWSFAWSSNLSLTLRASANEFDTLLVGALTDPASAGMYQIAKRVGRLAQQVGAQVQSVLYPDIARLWAERQLARFRKSVLQVECLLAGFGVIVLLFFLLAAEPLLRWTAGPPFVGAAGLVVVQMVAVAIGLMGIALRSALLAMGEQRPVLLTATAATLTFYVVALLLVPELGPMGANIGHIALGTVTLAGLAMALGNRMGRRQALVGAMPASAAREDR